MSDQDKVRELIRLLICCVSAFVLGAVARGDSPIARLDSPSSPIAYVAGPTAVPPTRATLAYASERDTGVAARPAAYQWGTDPNHPGQVNLFRDGVFCGGYELATGIYRDWDGAVWSEPRRLPVGVSAPVGGSAPRPFVPSPGVAGATTAGTTATAVRDAATMRTTPTSSGAGSLTDRTGIAAPFVGRHGITGGSICVIGRG